MAAESRPPITALTSRARVLEAIRSFDDLGREQFLARYGYGPAMRYRLRHEGKTYDSKAIAGVAWGLQHFDDPHQRPSSYQGGAHSSVPTLQRLGFEIGAEAPAQSGASSSRVTAPKLAPGTTYTWEELGASFGFPPKYLSLAGGMISRPKLNS